MTVGEQIKNGTRCPKCLLTLQDIRLICCAFQSVCPVEGCPAIFTVTTHPPPPSDPPSPHSDPPPEQ